jgi:uncharacterized protein (DUF1015 family)
VPRFEPFRGVRYDPRRVDLARVTSPPYDVIDGAARRQLAERDPCNAVCVDVPEPGDDTYGEARRQLDAWMADGTLRRDDPSFYVYRMTHEGPDGSPRHTTGVFGALELSHPGDGGILPHEHTTPKAKSDRLSLLRATRANLSAVWGLSPAPGLTRLLTLEAEPAVAWTDDGVLHEVWPLDDAEHLAAIAEAVAAHPVVIADGHHRYETSLTYRDEQRDLAEPDAPGADSVLTYVVELADDELEVLPIHRLVLSLPDGLDEPGALVEALGPWFVITDAGPLDEHIATLMAERGALVLVTPAGSWFLEPRPEHEAAGRGLDSSRLDGALDALGIGDVAFQHGVDEVLDAIGSGRARAGFLLRPATVAQIVEIAHGGERMPPKTTFFSPKPRTGVVFRLLDE